MRIALPIRNRALLAVAVGHAGYDFALGAGLLPYAVLMLPASPSLTTTMFVAASVRHFSTDVGLLGSVLLHACTAALAAANLEAATHVMLCYIAFVHAPLTAVRLLASRARVKFALVVAGIAASCLWRNSLVRDGEFELGHFKQMVVVGHVLCA